VVVDWKANSEKGSAGAAAMNLLVNAGIPVRTVSKFRIMHDKVIITDERNVETGSFNYTRAAARSNSENALVIGITRCWLRSTCSTGSPDGRRGLTGFMHTDFSLP
jgi:hypothetical protein